MAFQLQTPPHRMIVPLVQLLMSLSSTSFSSSCFSFSSLEALALESVLTEMGLLSLASSN